MGWLCKVAVLVTIGAAIMDSAESTTTQSSSISSESSAQMKLSSLLHNVDMHAIARSAVHYVQQMPKNAQLELLEKVKVATDGVHAAVKGAKTDDTALLIRGIGDAVGSIPLSGFGLAGIAFSLSASFINSMFGSSSPDPVLVALHELSISFQAELKEIHSALRTLQTQLGETISRIDRLLAEISDVPVKVVAEMKMSSIAEMKDKFGLVQHAANWYAQGNLTSDQMAQICDDYQVSSLFSELGTILKDENGLFSAKFGTQDQANGLVQLHLLLFYVSVAPLVGNCNALKYPFYLLQSIGNMTNEIVHSTYQRASWLASPATVTVHVHETFEPEFRTRFSLNSTGLPGKKGSSFHFLAYSRRPPHGKCFRLEKDGAKLQHIDLGPMDYVQNGFCVKQRQADNCRAHLLYAAQGSRTIVHPATSNELDDLSSRGWKTDVESFYVDAVKGWKQKPLLTLVEDFVILRAGNPKVTVEQLTDQCRKLGSGYDRDGDGHTKDRTSNRLWRIFCVKYVQRTVRDIVRTNDGRGQYLTDVRWIEMKPKSAEKEECSDGFIRDRYKIHIPTRLGREFFVGTTTIRVFAVCLKWEKLSAFHAPNDYVNRIWIDDTRPYTEKTQMSRNEGKRVMDEP